MQVEWKESALDTLADIYVLATVPQRELIAATVERITRRLGSDPWFLGESRGTEHRRVWFHFPLVVGFELVIGQPKVNVYHVALLLLPQTDGDESE